MLMSQTKTLLPSFSIDSILDGVVKSWVTIVLIGQWMFALYIFILYAMPSLLGSPELASKLSPATGMKKSLGADLTLLFVHILPAIIMAASGLLQLFPQLRKQYPSFHRWNGRVFFVLALSGAFTGMYLTWVAGLRLSDIGAMGVSFNGMLIPIFIALAWYTAVTQRFAAHQRFATHSFILVNGVWFFRLYLMGWFVMNQGANGNTNKIDGPADIAISFLCYLLPMAILECVLFAKRSSKTSVKWMVTMFASLGALITLIGVGSAVLLMWFPRIQSVFDAL
ncbi:DUF2306 domain-containing protein [Pseudoalteromonas xiamenensis]